MGHDTSGTGAGAAGTPRVGSRGADRDDALAAAAAGLLGHLTVDQRHAWNWGCEPCGERGVWDLDVDAYVNGVLVTVDLDVHVGWVLEVVDRAADVVRYLAVVQFHGPRPDGSVDADTSWMPGDAGAFFARTVPQPDAGVWGVREVYRLVDARVARRATVQPATPPAGPGVAPPGPAHGPHGVG